MTELGRISIVLSVVSCLWAVLALSIGLKQRHDRFIRSGRHGIIAAFVLSSLAVIALEYAFLVHDYSLRYVWEHSSQQQPLVYRVTALWGGMAGSLLFWFWLLCICGLILVWQAYRQRERLIDFALVPLAITQLFFAILTTGIVRGMSGPFEELMRTVTDGRGMNPLLQTPSMVLHPPTLYIGFVSMTVPFAFAVGSLASGGGGSRWISLSRRWTIFAWLSLAVGIILGGGWAYGELGWGGYWAWDPVENASLMPWLLSTAFLHSVMVQERRNMLKIWNLLLIVLAFEFTLFGTFITRSGIISSVHAFGQSDIGHYFLGFIVLSGAGVAALMILRWDQLQSPNRLDSFLSRESAFLLNNWLLVGMTATTLWGTMYPILSEAVTGDKISVSEPFFNKVNVPLGLAMLIMTGIGSVISWKKATASNFRRAFLWPTILGLVGAVISVGLFSYTGYPIATLSMFYTFLCIFAAIFVLAITLIEFHRGAWLRMKRDGSNPITATITLISRNKRRYGGYIVHIGIVFIFIGILGSKGYQRSIVRKLAPGESTSIAGFDIRFDKQFTQQKSHVLLEGVELAVSKEGKQIGTMRPARGHYNLPDQQPTTEAAMRRRLRGDLYVAYGGMEEDGQTRLQIYYNPLVSFVWIGSFIMLFGGVVCLAQGSYQRKDFGSGNSGKA